MNMIEIIKKSTLMTILALIIIACSSKPDIKEFPKSADSKEEITNLELALENSRSEDSELLAPVSFKEAKNSLSEAKKMEKDDKKEEKVLKKVALGQAYLDRARDVAEENRSKLQDVLAARQSAMKAEANTHFPKEFAKMDKKVKAETAKIEEDEKNELKEKRSDFITGYLDLELAAIKKKYLGESRVLIDEAVKNGARDLTPKTLTATNKKYSEADLYITQNRHNAEEIEVLSSGVLEDARNLEATTAKARGLAALTPEEAALRMQSEEEQLSKTQEALASEHETKKALAAAHSKLSEEQQLNAIYEEAREKFTPEEAEVYKQGNNLVIRLRALQFPTAQAVLKGDNFAVLKKVEDVIESFDQSAVIVEGHTDSTGSKQINQKLSEDRAQAVKQYLEANTAEKVTEIESQGFGWDKPLASNKTQEGRAQNRRVDIIIEPVKI